MNQDISYDNVLNVVNNLNINKSCGIDNIEISKQVPVVTLIHNLFMYSFNMSIVHSLWLEGIIVPVPKGNNKDLCAPLNYRGIYVFSCVSKVYTDF